MAQDPFHVPLGFHSQLLKDHSTDSGLFVCARGLGLKGVIKSFMHLCADPRLLVFVVGLDDDPAASEWPEDSQTDDIYFETSAHIHCIKPESTAKERSFIYDKGGVVLLSSRVLLMDLLLGRIPVPLVTGVIVNSAHRVAEYGLEAFCLYLLRLQNDTAFIKAFSDNPEFLIRGFAKAEKILKTLRVSNLVLYPRFHVQVNDELSHASIEIVEINVACSQQMKMIQMSILSILESSIGDVCKDNSVSVD